MEDLTTLQQVLVFAGIPGLVVLIAALAILAPGWTRAGRYRPGDSWNYEPVLINASVETDVKTAIAVVASSDLEVSGRSAALLVREEGGASARW